MQQDYIDSKGRMYCGPHRREVCNICCVDHRVTNEIMRAGKDADIDAILARHEKLQQAEHAAMVQKHAAEGGRGPIMLGSEESQRLCEAAASRPGQPACAQCGLKGDKLMKCARCRQAFYCCKEHQRLHYPEHKAACRAAAAAAAAAAAEVTGSAETADGASTAAGAASGGSSGGSSSSKQELISWKQLERLQGQPAVGKVLELRVMSTPVPFLRHTFEGKDHKGEVHRVAFYSDTAPPGLELGKLFRWRNPRFQWFVDGSNGARIEDQDLPNISIVAG